MKQLASAVRHLCRTSRPISHSRATTRVTGAFTSSKKRQYSTGTTSQSNQRPWSTSAALLFAGGLGLCGYFAGTRRASNELEGRVLQVKTPVYATKDELVKAIAEMEAILGEDAISTDDEDLKAHGFSEWSSININQLPVVVVYPKSTEEVSQIAKIATKYKCPMIPYSGGSSLEANFSAPYGGISIDFAYMDKILAVHEDDMDVVVQPSIQWMALNDALKGTGLFFPVDPGPSAKIGGMIGTGCSGTNAFRYGTMKDYVLNLTVVLPDGRIIKTRQRPRKSSAGYNLNGIFVGAEGTLGIVTEATLKLVVVPPETKVGVVSFNSIRDAAITSMQIIRSGATVAAMELLDDVQMMVVNKAGGTKRVWDEKPTLFFKFAGTPVGVQDSIKLVSKISEANDGSKMIYAKDDKEAQELWKARKDSLWSMLSLREEGDEVWSTDVAVPISRLPDLVEISKKEIDDLGLFASVLGHIGDGNFHSSIMYNRKDPEIRKRVETAVENMVHRAIEMEGTCTGEHGIGLGKKQSLVHELGLETIEVMKTLKRSLDPHWIMNPGKIFDAVHTESSVGHLATAANVLKRPDGK